MIDVRPRAEKHRLYVDLDDCGEVSGVGRVLEEVEKELGVERAAGVKGKAGEVRGVELGREFDGVEELEGGRIGVEQATDKSISTSKYITLILD